MTRVDFLKLIPAALLALLWPEAKAETGALKTSTYSTSPITYMSPDGMFVFGGADPDIETVTIYGGLSDTQNTGWCFDIRTKKWSKRQ